LIAMDKFATLTSQEVGTALLNSTIRMGRYFDDEEFPFSFDEVVAAVSLWYTASESVWQAEQFELSSQNNVEARALDMLNEAGGAKRPKKEYERVRLCSFVQFEWLWPTLSILPTSSERARTWMHFHWRFRYMILLAGARQRSGERAGTYKNHDLTPERSKELRETGEVQEFRNFAKDNITLPEATVENLVEAFLELEVEQAAFAKLAAEARDRYDRRAKS
jgi:hypothetical protein